MKKRVFIYPVVFTLLLLSSSCSRKIAFTSDVRNKVEHIGLDLKKIQYYNSNEIILRRQIDSSQVKVASGVIKYENGKYIEEIIIKRGTFGVCEDITDKKRIKVSFEEGENKTLTFGSLNPSTNRYYILGAKEWKNYKTMTTYDGKEYTLATPNGIAYLQIKNQKEINKDKDSRVAKGKKVK